MLKWDLKQRSLTDAANLINQRYTSDTTAMEYDICVSYVVRKFHNLFHVIIILSETDDYMTQRLETEEK